MQTVERKSGILKDHIAQKRLKSSRQRDEIARFFFNIDGHINTDELYRRVADSNPKIGLSTVYRTLKLLTECGLALERKFANGQSYFENTDMGEHHDHLICSACGKIVEFRDDQLERLQEEVAARHGFVIKDHRMEIYGHCPQCQTGKPPRHQDTKKTEE